MKSIAIVTKGRNTCQALQEQLEGFLGNRANITGYYVDGGLDDKISADVVLISGKHAYERVLSLVDPGSSVVLARRSINYDQLDQLFDLPENTDVLLVNDLSNSAEDTISLLRALGIDHINYYPYFPGITEYPHLKIAVTPGEIDLVPECVDRIIDIKTRVVDITSLTEVLQKLDLLDEKANLLSANYLQDIIKLIKKSKHSMNVSNKIKNQLQTIINAVHDGIIAVDNERQISVFNPVAETLLGLKSAQMIGSRLDTLTDQDILSCFLSACCDKSTLVKVNNHQLVVNLAKVQEQDTEWGKVYTFKDVSEIQRLEEELRRKLVDQLHIARYTFEHMQGESEAVSHTVRLARKMAESNAPILIQGESGTGKEVLAQGIHNASPRKNGPFIAVNFAAMTESLLESELFGYEGGAFTGARKGGSAGLFERAHKGTIFLDEVGDAPLTFQVKLLRVLQEKQVRRVGGAKIIPIDVRVIAATNRDLKQLITKGGFRQDLYYRLNVLPLRVPSLKDRKSDILLIAKDFYNAYSSHSKKLIPADLYFGRIASQLLSYDWPGNIRELQNVVEYLVSICPDRPPSPDMLVDLQMKEKSSDIMDVDVSQLILSTIAEYNNQGKAIGRRSLAQALLLPESTIRRALTYLQQEGLVQISRGRKGLQIAKC